MPERLGNNGIGESRFHSSQNTALTIDALVNQHRAFTIPSNTAAVRFRTRTLTGGQRQYCWLGVEPANHVATPSRSKQISFLSFGIEKAEKETVQRI